MLRAVFGDAVAKTVRSHFEQHLVVRIGMAAPCAAPACVVGHEFAVELRLRFANQPSSCLRQKNFLDMVDVVRQFGMLFRLVVETADIDADSAAEQVGDGGFPACVREDDFFVEQQRQDFGVLQHAAGDLPAEIVGFAGKESVGERFNGLDGVVHGFALLYKVKNHSNNIVNFIQQFVKEK